MGNLKITTLQKKDYQNYEKFLLEIPESLLYYSTKYKELLEEYLRVESEYLLAIDEQDNIWGVLPLMKKEGKFGTIINSLPFYGSNGGILSKNDEVFKLLLVHYNNLIKNVASSTYITNPFAEHQNIKPTHNITDRRVGQWTFIGYEDSKEENIMKSFESSARRNVRKALKEQVAINIDNSQIDFLYEVHYENINSIGGEAKEKRFFKLVKKYFKPDKDYNIYVATLNGEKIGALLILYYNQTVEYFTPAVVSEYRNLQALPLIIYKAMTNASEKGYKWWNWGGTWLTQDGVYRLKKKFGAVNKEYEYFIKINNQDIYNSNKNNLRKEYNDFYVIPFDKLKG